MVQLDASMSVPCHLLEIPPLLNFVMVWRIPTKAAKDVFNHLYTNTRNPKKRAAKCIRYGAHSKPAKTCGAEGPSTQISGWKDPLETDTRWTRNMLSMCMKPSPTFHRSSTVPSKVSFYNTIVSGHGVDHIKARTYSDTVEIPFDLLGNLVGKFATRYR